MYCNRYKDALTADYVRSVIDYNPITGIFTRRFRAATSVQNNAKFAGKPTGSVGAKGYIIISIDNIQYQAHRLGWLIMTGEWPKEELDHQDLNKSNNKWNNLRLANASKNAANVARRKDNTSGFKGVNSKNGKWVARISIKGQRKNLGYFENAEQAYAAYCEAAKLYHGAFARIA